MSEHEMRRTFNQGIGFVFVVPQADAARATTVLQGLGDRPLTMGRVVKVGADRAFEERVEWPA